MVLFTKNKVIIKPLKISNGTLESLEDNLCLYFTKFSRSADKILKNQNSKTKKNNKEIIKNLQFNKELGMKSKIYLENEKLDDFAEILNEQWRCKFERSPETINPRIKNLYDIGLRNGATGGKLIGAGGGGFLMFYAKDKALLRDKMKKLKLPEVRFSLDSIGTDLICK